ncbi:MAG: polysaccharide deacetylase family protein [Anaerolineaceae bacterium]|nr:polysaccharide deacetylase family protein [Anaerolineaceae bacterium]
MGMHSFKKRFPNGKTRAFTMSYDDGTLQDRQLVALLNRYGIRGTFNLNAGFFGRADESFAAGERAVNHSVLPADEIAALYANHEVALHGLNHPWLAELPREVMAYELLEDKRRLEALIGYPVRGMAYPYGSYNQIAIEVLRGLGVEHARTTQAHHGFDLPQNFLEWSSTCHQGDPALIELTEAFLAEGGASRLKLFYVWGHSFEFDDRMDWSAFERFCQQVSGHSDVWYATNIEIVDYLNAWERLKFSADGSLVLNPSAVDVWVEVNGKVNIVPAGQMVRL